MQQQLAPPGWLVIFAISMRVLADVSVQQPGFVAGHFGKAVLELDFAVLGRFDLGSGEGQARFIPLQQMVVMPGLAIIAQDFDSRLHGFEFLYSTRGKLTASSVYVVQCSLRLAMVSSNAA